MRAQSALVVKLGGSLLPRVPGLVEELQRSERPLLLVPGGGPFADQVRTLGLDGDEGHWMAIAGMEQFGWYIASKGVPATDRLVVDGGVSVLLPYRVLREEDPLPHTWEVTSDTIAAWVAERLHLDLLLIKSVDRLTVGGKAVDLIEQPECCDEVDPCLIPFVLSHGIRAAAVNGQVDGRVAEHLRGAEVPCTAIRSLETSI
ncbi:amino acid kinase family protein [Methanosphaerula subterraneus]|uniref:amino acid kinase family protein n=1 Tax=Methanosphaerula subterraneus TaxID=3350244 RepID=UPI003F864BED